MIRLYTPSHDGAIYVVLIFDPSVFENLRDSFTSSSDIIHKLTKLNKTSAVMKTSANDKYQIKLDPRRCLYPSFYKLRVLRKNTRKGSPRKRRNRSTNHSETFRRKRSSNDNAALLADRATRLKLITTELSSALTESDTNHVHSKHMRSQNKYTRSIDDEKVSGASDSDFSNISSILVSNNAEKWINNHEACPYKSQWSSLLCPAFLLLLFTQKLLYRVCRFFNMTHTKFDKSMFNQLLFSRSSGIESYKDQLRHKEYPGPLKYGDRSTSYAGKYNLGNDLSNKFVKDVGKSINSAKSLKRKLNVWRNNANTRKEDFGQESNFFKHLEQDFDDFQAYMTTKLLEEVEKTRTAERNLHVVHSDFMNHRYRNMYLMNRINKLEDDSTSMSEQSEKYRKCLKSLQKRTKKAEHKFDLMKRTSAQIFSETNTLCLRKENELAESVHENERNLRRINELESEVDSLVDLLYKCEDKLVSYDQLLLSSPCKLEMISSPREQDLDERKISEKNCDGKQHDTPLAKREINLSIDSITESPGVQAKLALVDCINDMDTFEKRFSFEDDRLEVEAELRVSKLLNLFLLKCLRTNFSNFILNSIGTNEIGF